MLIFDRQTYTYIITKFSTDSTTLVTFTCHNDENLELARGGHEINNPSQYKFKLVTMQIILILIDQRGDYIFNTEEYKL